MKLAPTLRLTAETDINCTVEHLPVSSLNELHWKKKNQKVKKVKRGKYKNLKTELSFSVLTGPFSFHLYFENQAEPLSCAKVNWTIIKYENLY